MRRDPVTPALRLAVLQRDGGCVAVRLGESPADCRSPLTLDHVKDAPRIGRRAPSYAAHLVTICRGHHIDTPVGNLPPPGAPGLPQRGNEWGLD